jgi:hypothetical protein
MKSLITTAALTGMLAITIVTDAFAWERKASVTGPLGTNTFNAQGSCSGSSCSRSATATGAYGNTAARTGAGSCSGNSCSQPHDHAAVGTDDPAQPRRLLVTQ